VALGFAVDTDHDSEATMRLHNTLTGRIEPLSPREEGRFSMYVCGPTVQAAPHFGHARAALVPDVLRRYLEWTGVEVLHVRNITDVEDKIIDKSKVEDRHPMAVAEEYTRIYEDQIGRLGILPPHIAPRATGHIIEMIELIEALIAGDHAYESDGDVFFAVRTFPAYGKLSGRKVDELRAGARIETDERKRDPLDFALWKRAKPGEPSWPSPWGDGRPGWHIECSAMARKYLGDDFDLHTGGLDLAFPHHENEIAQSEAATGQPFARHWLHNGLLNIGGEKMSKSVGNVISLAEALDTYGGAVLRFFYLAAHYRSPVELSDDRLAEATAAVERWRAFLRAVDQAGGAGPDRGGQHTAPVDDGTAARGRKAFIAAMEDDLSTPRAHAALFELVSAGNQALAGGQVALARSIAATFTELVGVLGYDLTDEVGGAGLGDVVAPLVEALLRLRTDARARKDFGAADAIRNTLATAGVVVEDTPEGARWHLESR
jgi:cysteinyl-tRNA synthetase